MITSSVSELASASLRFEGVTLRLRSFADPKPSLKRAAVALARGGARPGQHGSRTLFDGLDLSFGAGERVAIVGANGAGKTTLLKMACGIYRPAEGRVVARGRVSALIEMGAGLNMELSGEDNIYLLGALHGRRRSEIRERIGPVLDFAELHEARHTPIKYYSHGMRLRLAFAAVTELEPEILLVDEVFAGGDLSFVRRARERMRGLIDRSHLLVMVSHNLALVRQLCDRCVWLDEGRVVADGATGEVLPRYTDWHRSRSKKGDS